MTCFCNGAISFLRGRLLLEKESQPQFHDLKQNNDDEFVSTMYCGEACTCVCVDHANGKWVFSTKAGRKWVSKPIVTPRDFEDQNNWVFQGEGNNLLKVTAYHHFAAMTGSELANFQTAIQDDYERQACAVFTGPFYPP